MLPESSTSPRFSLLTAMAFHTMQYRDKIECSIVFYGPGLTCLMIEFVPYTSFVANKNFYYLIKGFCCFITN